MTSSAFVSVTPVGASTRCGTPSATSFINRREKVTNNVRKSTRSVRLMTKMKAEMPDEAKAAAARGENVQYWAGEWICVDCGFIYKPARKIKFEDLAASWKCPQCNAPKRRFAKKAGDFIKETASTSNLPIIVFSIGGLIATVVFGIWASSNL